ANHDLVMADLSLGGGAILPAPEQAIYIFDEAHRLGDTTLRHFAASCRLKATVQWLEQLEKGLAITAKTLAGDTGLVSQLDQIGAAAVDVLQNMRQAAPFFSHILDEKLPANATHYRFPLGDVGLEIRDLSAVLARGFIKLHGHLDDL